MHNIFKTSALIILVSCSSSASEISSDDTDLLPYQIINEKILFIGNSFTFYWNLPSQIEKMSIE